MPLPSAPIDQFEEATTVQPNDWAVIFQVATGKTLKTRSSNFGIDSPSSNYNWSSTFDYPVDDIVEYQGKLYKSLQTPNVGQVPTAAGSTYWELVVKATSSSLAVWAPGTYIEEQVFVMYDLNQDDAAPDWGLYALKNPPARPFISSNFVTELAAGNWVIVAGGGPDHFKGAFASEAALISAFPTALAGDYALVDTAGPDAALYIWDDTDSQWVASGITTIVPDADATTKGIARLYPSTSLGTNTDGAPTQNAVKVYTDTAIAAAVLGLYDDRGNFNASVNAYPSSGGSGSAGAILKGDVWTVSVAGTLPTAQAVSPGDTVRALIDAPGNTQANWAINSATAGATTPDASSSVKGKAKLYPDLTASNTDGAPDQASVSAALAALDTLNNVALSGGNLTLAWASDQVKNFDLTTTLAGNATIIFSGSSRRKGKLFLRCTGACILTFPSGTYMDLYEKSVGRWDTAGTRQLELTGITASPFMLTFDFDALGNAIVHASNRLVTS